jgi:hypothetical protein
MTTEQGRRRAELWRVPFLGEHRGASWRTSGARSDGRPTAGRWPSFAWTPPRNSTSLVIANADGSSERVLTTRRVAGRSFHCSPEVYPPYHLPGPRRSRDCRVWRDWRAPDARSSLSTWSLALKSCAILEAASCHTA